MNNTNSSFEFNQVLEKVEKVVSVTSWSLGILFCLFTLFLIISSKSKLIKLEFYILLTFIIASILFRSLILTTYLFVFFFRPMLTDCLYMCIHFSSSSLFTKLSFTLLYYSLFQASSVSRSKLFLLIHLHIHKPRTFVIFEAVTIAFQLVLLFAYAIVINLKNGGCPTINEVDSNLFYVRIIVFNSVPSLLPILIYLTTVCYISRSRLFLFKSRQKKQQLTSTKKKRRDVVLLFKFLSLAVVIALSNLLLNVYYVIANVNNLSFLVYFLVGYSSFFLFAIQPLFLLYIHSILKNAFKSLMSL